MTIFEKYNLNIGEVNGSVVLWTDIRELRILSHFLDYWDKSLYIKEDLLPELTPVLDGTLEFNDIGADVVGSASIYQQITKLSSSELGFSDFELPTEDFYALILEWCNYLERANR